LARSEGCRATGTAVSDRGYRGAPVSGTGSKTTGASQKHLYNFSNSASFFGSVTGALQVKFSQT
jgi:hypothetical protein